MRILILKQWSLKLIFQPIFLSVFCYHHSLLMKKPKLHKLLKDSPRLIQLKVLIRPSIKLPIIWHNQKTCQEYFSNLIIRYKNKIRKTFDVTGEAIWKIRCDNQKITLKVLFGKEPITYLDLITETFQQLFL